MSGDVKDEGSVVAHKEILGKLLSLKVVGFVVVVGVIVISVSKFIDSVSTLANALPIPQATISAFDTKTQEQTLSVAKKIDDLCSSLVESYETPYSRYAEKYRVIDVELKNLLLRQESRSLNSASVEQQRLVIENFNKIWEAHKSEDKLSKLFVTEVRQLFHAMFQKILYLEASKPKK